MTPYAIAFGLGLVGLYFGAEWLVRGAARLALSFGVSALVIGLTVVALGTSAPELVVSGIAAARGSPEVAIGNVIGSNILNVALILGVAALIFPLRVEVRLVRREIPLMIIASVFMTALAIDLTIARIDAVILLVAFVGYIAFVLGAARRETPSAATEYAGFERKVVRSDPRSARHRLRSAGLVLVGTAALVGGAHLLVTSSLFFARALGVSELVIGLTVVAIGTSLPELATSIVAALRKETDIALGNAVGSNIFNLLAILGVAALIRPIPVDPGLLRVELPIMILVSFLLLPLTITRLRIGRWEGALLVLGYLIFTGLLLARAGGHLAPIAVG